MSKYNYAVGLKKERAYRVFRDKTPALSYCKETGKNLFQVKYSPMRGYVVGKMVKRK